MAKNMQSEQINYQSIFNTLDTFTGLPIKQRGRRWYGSCRINGQPHSRRDKLCCYMSAKGNIRMIEQGEQSITLWDWLLEYGNCSDNLEVKKRLLSNSSGFTPMYEEVVAVKSNHVHQKEVKQTLWKYSDTLFEYLCTLFPREKVIEAYDEYQVGSRGDKTIFWYMNFADEYCYDKIMTYKSDGHRDKAIVPSRKYMLKDGYTDICFFGEHLLQDWKSEHFVVESEKTALIGYLYFNKPFIATGGSSCLHMIGSGSILLPDFDKAGESWKQWGNCRDWWLNFKGIDIQKGWDIGDAIIERIKIKKNNGK